MPKLQTIDGKTRHYAYTPAGRAAYLRDKGIDESGLGTDGQEGFKSAAKEISKRGDNAEKRRQSAMVMAADINDQSKGAEDYLKKKIGSGKQFEPNSYAKLKDFKNAAMDVLSESEITSIFPQQVWESAANRYLSNVWKKSSKAK